MGQDSDGVFQGGGVKVVALVGALLGFDEQGYRRWVSAAGASAGALLATFLACGHDARDAEELIRAAPFARFEDYGPGGRSVGGVWNLWRRHALVRGDFLHRWLGEVFGTKTFATVRDGDDYRLKLVAADVTRRQVLVFPDDLPQYRLPGKPHRIDPDGFPLADAVRMSMALPYFFPPLELVFADTGRRCRIVDGGLVSSFPVWLFDVADRDPARPTFGFHLTRGRGFGSSAERLLARAGWPFQLGFDLFHTAMEASDNRFLSHSTRVRTCFVPAGDIATTDFGITDLQRTELIERGRRAARAFLETFHPDDYVNTYGRRLAAGVRT